MRAQCGAPIRAAKPSRSVALRSAVPRQSAPYVLVQGGAARFHHELGRVGPGGQFQHGTAALATLDRDRYSPDGDIRCTEPFPVAGRVAVIHAGGDRLRLVQPVNSPRAVLSRCCRQRASQGQHAEHVQLSGSRA